MRPGMVFEQSPTLRTVSIMPGMDLRAPERQDTNKGFCRSPNFMPINVSVLASADSTSFFRLAGNFDLFLKKSTQHSVLMAKPAGTGKPSRHISARLAPLPPSRFFMLALPSVFFRPGPNKYTYFLFLTFFAGFLAGMAGFSFVGWGYPIKFMHRNCKITRQ